MRKAHQIGFTLIELLVVIAVIALLVSILVPSLSKAREFARISVCLSNLHGTGMGCLTKAAENQNTLYFAATGTAGGSSAFSTYVPADPTKTIMPPLSGNMINDTFKFGNSTATVADNWIGSGWFPMGLFFDLQAYGAGTKGLHCPSDPSKWGGGQFDKQCFRPTWWCGWTVADLQQKMLALPGFYMSYMPAQNHFCGGAVSDSAAGTGPSLDMRRVPSKMFMLMETTIPVNSTLGDTPYGSAGISDYGDPRYYASVHGQGRACKSGDSGEFYMGMSNFLDGHAAKWYYNQGIYTSPDGLYQFGSLKADGTADIYGPDIN